MNLSVRGSIAIWGFLALAILAVWGSRAAWATSNQSPAHQTVPTRVKSPTPGPPTNTPMPPTNTPVPPANTAVPTRVNVQPPTSTVVPATSSAPPTKTTMAAPMATAKENLRIRGSPSTSATVVGQLKKGDTVQIVGRSPANDWWQIALPTNPNARGWISAEFAMTNGAIDPIPVVKGSVVSTIAPTPTIFAAPTDTPFPSTSTAPAHAQVLPPPVDTPSAVDAPIEVVEPSESGNPMVSVVVGVVLLGIGGGFVLIILGGVIILLGRR